MEALNSTVFTPLSVFSDITKPTKISCKVSNFSTSINRKQNLKGILSSNFQKGLFFTAASIVISCKVSNFSTPINRKQNLKGILSSNFQKGLFFTAASIVISCKVSNFSTPINRKQNLRDILSNNFQKGLFLAASSVVNFNNGEFANALTYEEALGQSVTVNGGGDIDVTGFVDSVISFAAENPAILAGGVAILAVPLVLSQILKKPKAWGVESAKNAYAKLGADGNAQLLDIRGLAEIRTVGGPNVGGLKKKSASVAYKGDDKAGFLKKISLKFKESENTTLFILDKFDGNSELVAELVTLNGFKSAYAIKDGAEGPQGWLNSGLPWIEPNKAFSLDFGSLTDTINEAIGDTSDGLAVSLGIAAATGLGVLAFSEVETILQLLGSAAIIQFASKKLLFAEDRKTTIKQVEEFLNTKVAPKELVDEIKDIGKALLPTSTNNKALPAPTENVPELATAGGTEQKADTTPDIVSKVKVEAKTNVAAVVESAPEVNSVPKTEIKAESIPVQPKSLSPYPYYPDFKPPTSPSPSLPTDNVPEFATAASTVQKAEATPDIVSETKVEAETNVAAVVEPAPEVNSVPKTEIKAESIPEQPKPLSPYPYYPDFKPPTSPSPTQP